MKYAIAISVGMLAGFFVVHWLTGYSISDKSDFSTLVVLSFVAAGGVVGAGCVSSRWWDRRKK